MTTTTINSSPTILAQAKAFLNTPVVKKSAVAVASLAAAAAVAGVTYNNFFQNTSNSSQTDLMFTEAFPDVMNTATQCLNTTLISTFANSKIPQNVNGTNFCYLTPPQTFTDITVNATQNVSKSAELTLPQGPANVTNTNVSSAVELMFPLRFASVANTGNQCLNTSLIQTVQPINNQTIAKNKTEVEPEKPQNGIEKKILPDGQVRIKFDAEFHPTLFDKVIYYSIDLGNAAFTKTSAVFSNAADLSNAAFTKTSAVFSNAAQKVSKVLTEARNFGHETIFPRF